MHDINKICEYVCERYYRVLYKHDYYDNEQRIEGVLLNYNSGNIVLLTEAGIYHIGYKDIVFMRPIEVPLDRINEDFKDLLESFKGVIKREECV